MSYYKSAKTSITKGQISVIKMAQGQLGITDDDYRSMLQERFKVRSCTKLTFNQAGILIEELQKKGFELRPHSSLVEKVEGKTKPRRAGNEPQDQKIRALWLELHELGIIRDSSEQAMLAFVKRQTGRDALPWCSVTEKQMVIESLKKMGYK